MPPSNADILVPQQSLPQMTPTDSDDDDDDRDDEAPIPPQERQQSQQQQSIQVLIQKKRDKTKAKQDTTTSYHSICHARGPIRKPTPPVQTLKPIELADALQYALNLGIADPTYESKEYAWIVFYDQQTLESFTALHVSSDAWQLSMPTYESDINVCDTYYADADADALVQIITKFFEGDSGWRTVREFEFNHEVFEINVESEREGWG